MKILAMKIKKTWGQVYFRRIKGHKTEWYCGWTMFDLLHFKCLETFVRQKSQFKKCFVGSHHIIGTANSTLFCLLFNIISDEHGSFYSKYQTPQPCLSFQSYPESNANMLLSNFLLCSFFRMQE